MKTKNILCLVLCIALVLNIMCLTAFADENVTINVVNKVIDADMTSFDVQIKVTTYKNTDETTARGRFLRENDDYIFEDMMGYPACGIELDCDTLWFNVHQSGGNVYIVSWEYPKNASDELKTELSKIAESFKIVE